jgi:hypothetical protein
VEELKSKFTCPECDRAILNRKVNRCLFCGATLPAELLFTQEKIDELNEQQRVLEQRRQSERYPQVGDASGGFDIGGAIDLAGDIGGLLD